MEYEKGESRERNKCWQGCENASNNFKKFFGTFFILLSHTIPDSGPDTPTYRRMSR